MISMKKLFGLFAAVVISACLITGCGNDKKEDMSDTTSQTTQSSSTQETSKSITENGEVSDSDGFIGNEEDETKSSGSDMMDDIEEGMDDIMGDRDNNNNNNSDTVTNPSETIL